MAIAIIGPKFYGFDPDTGKPLAGGKVYFYQAGTVDTPLDTYTDETGETANSNPVILNAAGYAGIYLKGVYKVVLTDAQDNVIYTVEPVNSELQQLNEWIKDQPITVVDASRFTVPGNQTDLFEAGRAIRITNQTGDTYSYGFITDSSYTTDTTVTVELSGESVVNAGDIGAAVGLLTKNSFGGFSAKEASEFGQLREDLKSTGGAAIVFTESGESVQEAITRLNELNNEALIEEHNEDTEAHPALTQFITQQIELANLAAEAAISVGNIYETIEAGIAATNQDDYFMVPTDNENIYATLYRNTSESGGTQRTAVFSPSPGDPAVAVKTLAADAFGDEYTAKYALTIPQYPGVAKLNTVVIYFQGRRAGATWATIGTRSYVQIQGETSDFYPNQSITGDYTDAGENCEFRLVLEETGVVGSQLTADQLEYQEGAAAGGALEIKVYPSKTALDNALEQIEQAKEAALSSGLIYPDTATGLAATEDNAYFSVVSPEADEYTILYQKVGGLAVERKRLATSAFVNDAVTAAETAADVAMTAGWVYPDVASGEAARSDGEYFWVVSADDSEVLELWRMGASSATDTGKRTVDYKKVSKLEEANYLSYTAPNIFPDIYLDDLSHYKGEVDLSYVVVNGERCLKIDASNSINGVAFVDVPRDQFSQDNISASLEIVSASSGSGKRILLMQYDGASEISGTRQTANLTTSEITETTYVSFSAVSLDPNCDTVRFYFDAGINADNIIINNMNLCDGINPIYRQSKPVSQKQVKYNLDLIQDTNSDLLDAKNQIQSQYPNYMGINAILPEQFSDIPVSIEMDFFAQSVKLIYDESDPASESSTKITYYVSATGGSSSNSGLDPDNPINGLGILIDELVANPPTDDVEIILSDGIYHRDKSPIYDRLWSPQVNVSIKSEGEAILTSGDLGSEFSWTNESGVWRTSRSGVLNMWDASKRDYRGIPLFLTKKDSILECQQEKNSWYTDGSDIWINTFDGREPDGEVIVNLNVGAFTMYVGSGLTLYMENVKWLINGGSANDSFNIASPSGSLGYLKAINCAFCGSSARNGLDADLIFSYMRDCTASYNGLDGFNYHDNINNNQAVAIEYGCHGYANGTEQTGTNNGSTCHDGMRVIRANCMYFDCFGPIFADVNGCYSFNVNCFGAKSTRPDGSTRSNFYFDNAVAETDGEAWLVGCGGADSLYDISSDGTYKINVRGWRGAAKINQNTESNIVIY